MYLHSSFHRIRQLVTVVGRHLPIEPSPSKRIGIAGQRMRGKVCLISSGKRNPETFERADKPVGNMGHGSFEQIANVDTIVPDDGKKIEAVLGGWISYRVA